MHVALSNRARCYDVVPDWPINRAVSRAGSGAESVHVCGSMRTLRSRSLSCGTAKAQLAVADRTRLHSSYGVLISTMSVFRISVHFGIPLVPHKCTGHTFRALAYGVWIPLEQSRTSFSNGINFHLCTGAAVAVAV